MKPDSVYIVASITKPVTATALMILVERGKVSLSEPVTHYLPEFTGGERPKVRVLDRVPPAQRRQGGGYRAWATSATSRLTSWRRPPS